MRNSIITLLFLALCVLWSQSSCTYDNEQDLYGAVLCDTTEAVSYSATVVPILQNFCTSCHNADEATADIAVDTYDDVKALTDSGALLCVINHEPDCAPMPDDLPQIPECDRLAIKRWIESGALND